MKGGVIQSIESIANTVIMYYRYSGYSLSQIAIRLKAEILSSFGQISCLEFKLI